MRKFILLFVICLSTITFAYDEINVSADELVLSVDFNTSPKANTPFAMGFVFTRGQDVVQVENLRVSYNMRRMNMGNFIFTPVNKDGKYIADGIILPRCMSGSREWHAILNYDYNGRSRQTTFSFELEK